MALLILVALVLFCLALVGMFVVLVTHAHAQDQG
jgi:flagellar basal body-associated protein FliL